MLTSRSAAEVRVTSSPASRMRPALTRSRPAIRRRVDVLPQPLGPSRVTMVRGAIVNDTSFTARALP